jgi:hypothetical protein
MLSPHCLGVLVRLENSSFSQGTGTLKFDEKALARVAGTAVNKLRQAVKEILAWCGDLCRAVGDTLHFPRAISELAYSEARSAIARANRQAGLAKKPKLGSKICPSMESDLKPSFDKKSNEINDDVATTVEQRSDSSPLHKESSLRSDSESAKADSCHPQADDDPFAPDPSRMGSGGAGPSKPASGAGCNNPDPQPAESQQAAPDGAGLPKNSAQKGSVRSAEFMAAWNAMPKMARKRSSLDLAEKEWKKLKPHEREDVLRAIPIWEDNEYAKGAHRWLRDKLFQGLIDAEGEVSKPRAPSYRDAYRNAEEDCPA